MGNSGSSATKKSRKERDAARIQKIQSNLARLDQGAQRWTEQHQHSLTVPARMDEMRVWTVARDQIQRGDRPLTKADLVAILIRLQPSIGVARAQSMYQNLNAKELIVLIREIIYDPSIAPSRSDEQRIVTR